MGVVTFLKVSGTLVSIVALFVILLSLTSESVVAQMQPDPGNGCNYQFCLNDAYNSGGNQTIEVCSGAPDVVAGFNFWYNGTGPFNLTDSQYQITTAVYDNETTYIDALGLSNETGESGCVSFTLNGSLAPFTTVNITINMTIGNLSEYSSAPDSDRASFTINYVSVEALARVGTVLPNTLLMTFNEATKRISSQGPALTNEFGHYAQHCLGVMEHGNCITLNVTRYPNNSCVLSGIPFPASSGLFNKTCDINSTQTLLFFDFISSNITYANVTPGTTLSTTVPNTSTVGFIQSQSFPAAPGPLEQLNVTNYTVFDYVTGATVFETDEGAGGEGPEGGLPFFVNPNQLYTISANISGIGVRSYPFLSPSSGITGAIIISPNASVSEYSTVVGKVINESGSALANVTVFVQFAQGGGSIGIEFFNSTVTDENGLFTVTVPRTQTIQNQMAPFPFPYPEYKFLLVSKELNNDGVPLYFPTVDDNGGRGYTATSGTVILKPLTIKAGGLVSVNVTLVNATQVFSELTKTTELGTGTARSGVTGKISEISIFSSVSPPDSIEIPIIAPVTAEGRVFYSLFGKLQSEEQGPGPGGSVTTGVCQETIAITQGAITPSVCTLSQHGTLNLSVSTVMDIFNPSNPNQETLSDFSFWFDTALIVRNVTNDPVIVGNPVMFVSPGGPIFEDLVSFGGESSPILEVPLPPGEYTLELKPTTEKPRYLSIHNTTHVNITANQTTVATLTRGQRWEVGEFFSGSLTLNGNNELFVQVRSMGSPLTNDDITVTGKMLYLNKTEAGNSSFSFVYDPMGPGGGSFNTTLNPSQLGITGGKYKLMLNATNVTGSVSYAMTSIKPVNIFDFTLNLNLGFTFGTGQTVVGDMFAYYVNKSPVSSNTSPIIIQMFDRNGNPVTSFSGTASGISDGEGTINLTMPNDPGFYNLVVTMNASEQIGVIDHWLQVSNFNVGVTLNKPNYEPTDVVAVTVQVTNSSSGSPLANASIDIVVDSEETKVSGETDSQGKVTLNLDPTTIASSGQWTFGFHNLNIEISKQTANNIINLNTRAGFEVRGLSAFVRPQQPVYQTDEEVIIDVFAPPFIPISAVTAIVDGNSSQSYTGTQVGPDYWRINLSLQSVGHHDVKVTMTDASANSQDFFTGFDVNSFIIKASTNKFAYDLGELINLTVSVSYPNASAVAAQQVIATLLKQPNGINTSENSSFTDSNGDVTMLLNTTQSGFHEVQINVGGQLQRIGVQISEITVTLLDGEGGNVITNYNAEAGGSVTLYVNASDSSGTPVADGSTVDARIITFGQAQQLPTNTTTNGNATITFSIPANAPAAVYGLDVEITTPSGEQGVAPPARLTVSGGSALQIQVFPNQFEYVQGETALFRSLVTFGNGTGFNGANITFEIGRPGGTTTTVGSALTDSSGQATVQYNISVNNTDGQYFLHAFVTSDPTIQAYSGFSVSSLDVVVTSPLQTYELGSNGVNITLFVNVTNMSTGEFVNATGGTVSIFTPNGQKIQSYSPVEPQPYAINISVPNEPSSLGSYPIKVTMNVNQSTGSDFILIDVVNATGSVNMSIPNITAGEWFLLNITSTNNATATLRVFSPSTASPAYENTSIPLTPNASVNITLDDPGVYIFSLFVPGLGSSSSVVNVAGSSSTSATVFTGSSTTTNTSSFTQSNDVYIMSYTENATAKVLTIDTTTNSTISYSVPLNQQSGDIRYGILSSSSLTVTGTYFVRLDTSTATALATTIFTVS